ncbi:MAG: cytochrome b/b6 domain-containing protein [Betaproteobacteria bacterium]|nr:cytochrome b/b6 domain-containing protein [Betaproteobacteria bacterium]
MPTHPRKIRVWDLPTRIFHWLLAACIVALLVSGKIGGEAMVWHARFGMLALALIVFRLVWGVLGPRYARFAQFVKGPAAIIDEIRGTARLRPGHNPLGALSVLAMLLAIGTQAGLGLFSSDDIAFDGPLARHVSDVVVDFATRWHLRLQWIVIGLVILHLAAIAWHQKIRKHNLLQPMVSGDQQVEGENAVAAKDDAATRARAALIFALALMLVVYLSR